jgi:hypothetical protein
LYVTTEVGIIPAVGENLLYQQRIINTTGGSEGHGTCVVYERGVYPETTSPDERIVMGKYIRRLGGWRGGALGEVVIVRSRWEREVGIKREYSEGVGGGSGAAYGSYDSRAPPADERVVGKGTRRRACRVLHLYQPADAVRARVIGQPMTSNIRIA